MIMVSLMLATTTPVAPTMVDQETLNGLAEIVTVTDDPLEPWISLHTKALLSEKSEGAIDVKEYFFSMSENRITKRRKYFMHVYRFYLDRSIRFYNTFNYAGPDGPVSLPITTADRKVSKCFPSLDQCSFVESFIVEIPEDHFLAFALKSDDLTPWHFKYGGRSGAEVRHLMVPAEAKAMLKRADSATRNR
jgi:hypothetical protein